MERAMSKAIKITSITLASLLIVIGIAVFLLSRVDTQGRFEALATDATGLTVKANGGVSVGLLPTLHIALKDVTVRTDNSTIVSIAQADVGLAFWPLLRRQVRIQRLSMHTVVIDIARERTGHFNFTKPAQSTRTLAGLHLDHISLDHATFRYLNKQVDKELKAADCSIDAKDITLATGNSEDILKHLALAADISCKEVRNDLFVGSDVHVVAKGEDGLFKFTPAKMTVMSGKGSGSIDANFNGPTPVYQIRFAVAQLHVDDLFKSLAPGKVGEGFLDFTTDMTVRGFNSTEMIRTAQGVASLQGKDLEIAIGNLDEKLSNYESSQNFNLIDVGAFFIAGPLGTVVTKGYNFATIFQATQGNTHVRLLVSHWQVADGIAHAKDVAMATKENRVAMTGALDFVNRDFDDVTVAILDNKGCARVEQRIRGPFNKPVIDKPNVFASVAGPITGFAKKIGKFLGAKCDVFYEGSVPP
jgi:AsmA protein